MTGTAGCGQGCGGCGKGCGCGGGRGSSDGVVRDGAFDRPVFFDGQLLTADDLQDLTAYVRGKSRLHNRYLIGSGVVCGLEVSCTAADAGSVLVRSGYALDCCGNDIVVACDQRVDIVQLVGALPADTGCTDPCAQVSNGKPNHDGDEQATGQATKGSKTDPGRSRARHYELVVEYAETQTELVAPYSSGEETSRECEPTRVREGYRFAVRCVNDKSARRPTLTAALACCAEIEAKLTELERATKTADGLADSATTELVEPSPEELAEAQQKLTGSPDLPQAKRLGGLAVRFAMADKQDLARQALDTIRESSTAVGAAVQGDPIASAEAAALEQHVASLATRLNGPLIPTDADRRLMAGSISGSLVSQALHSVVKEAWNWALCRLEQAPGPHCCLSGTLWAIKVPDDDGPALKDAAIKVTSVVRQMLIDCICAAVNPPCAPCEDEAVVLARVTVDRCEVVDICNQARRHAVTGTALRYWLPIEWLSCEIEKACCCGKADKTNVPDWMRKNLRDLAETDDCGWPQRWPKPWSAGHEGTTDPAGQAGGLAARITRLEKDLAAVVQKDTAGTTPGKTAQARRSPARGATTGNKP